MLAACVYLPLSSNASTFKLDWNYMTSFEFEIVSEKGLFGKIDKEHNL